MKYHNNIIKKIKRKQNDIWELELKTAKEKYGKKRERKMKEQQTLGFDGEEIDEEIIIRRKIPNNRIQELCGEQDKTIFYLEIIAFN